MVVSRRRGLMALGGACLERVGLLSVATLLPACRSAAEKLPELGLVPPFQLRDQAAQLVTEQQLAGRVWLAAFMFTRCPTICPLITARMREVQLAAEKAAIALQLVSFTVDPEYDTSPVLAAYVREHGVDGRSWSFLTGDIATIKRTAVEGFKVALEGKVNAGQAHLGLLHGSHLMLVDPRLRVRAYFRTSADQPLEEVLAAAREVART